MTALERVKEARHLLDQVEQEAEEHKDDYDFLWGIIQEAVYCQVVINTIVWRCNRVNNPGLQKPKTLEDIENTDDTDLISRADAVKTVIRMCSPICDWQDMTQQYPDCVVAEINALPSADAEQVTGKLKNHCDSLLKSDSDECKEQKSKLDLIRREDAIDAIDDAIDADSPQWAILRTKIGFLPSAEAEWIPCSERLPEESGTYLTTTAKGSVCTDHFYANSNDICGRHWSYHRRREPIAWMPLPKPYREDGEDYELATEQMEHDAMYEPTYNSEDGSM